MQMSRRITYDDGQEQDFIFLGDIAISIPQVGYKPNGGYSTWRRNTEKKIGKFYLQMGLTKASVVGSADNYYNIPGSDFHIRPVITYGYEDDMREALIVLDHEIVMYDGIFDAWSVPITTELLLEQKDVDSEVVLFNLDLFRGPITFRWHEFPRIFESYII